MLNLHDDPISGNVYKARLIMAFLDIPYNYTRYDVTTAETRTPAFLKLNPNGRIPLLVLDDGSRLIESNAILHYLADGSSWLPTGRLIRAEVLSWMFFEQYSHEPNVATLRFWNYLESINPAQKARIAAKRANGEAALAIMDKHLERNIWLVSGAPTIADIALFAYTHVAEEGGYKLSDYPAIQAWIKCIQALPKFVTMDD